MRTPVPEIGRPQPIRWRRRRVKGGRWAVNDPRAVLVRDTAHRRLHYTPIRLLGYGRYTSWVGVRSRPVLYRTVWLLPSHLPQALHTSLRGWDIEYRPIPMNMITIITLSTSEQNGRSNRVHKATCSLFGTQWHCCARTRHYMPFLAAYLPPPALPDSLQLTLVAVQTDLGR